MKSSNSTLPFYGFSSKPSPSYLILFRLFCLFFITCSSMPGYAGKANTTKTFNAPGSPLTGTESMRINLYLLNSNSTTILADGVLTEYNNVYHDSVTLEDAYKFTNINENLGLCRYGVTLAVERRPIIAVSDTLFLKLWKTTARGYQFEFISSSLNHPGMQAFLEDAYLGTSLPLALTGTTKFNFAVTNDVASGNINRFRIVYHDSYNATPLPVSFAFVKTLLLANTKVSVDWKVENEINITRYELERSANGTDFARVNSIDVARNNSSSNTYTTIDGNPFQGNNFYRVKSIERDGSIKLSQIVKVSNNLKNGNGTITIYPNPIRGSMVNIRFTDQPAGTYQVRLINNNGQVVYTAALPVNGSSITQSLNTGKKLSGGIYQLEVKAPDNTLHVQQAIVQE